MHFMGVNLWAVLVSALATMAAGFVWLLAGAVCKTVDRFDGRRSQ
jgi:hypothetical protein